MQKTLVVLLGPTGIGKTKTGIEIARYFNTEIVSTDSRQIYKELKIGTAVPSANELEQVKHHFIQSHSIHKTYNASLFEQEAMKLLGSLFNSYSIIIMTGGSMFYVDAVCKGIDFLPDTDPVLRQSLKTRLETEGLESLRLQLKKLDPDYYNKVDLKNPIRIIHALEICLQTGKPFSSFRTNTKKNRPFSIVKIGLNTDRKILHEKINQRVDKMVIEGLEKEARSVFPYCHLNALNTVGYREWFAHFNGDYSREKTIELIKRNTRRYARKQITWFGRDPEVTWFEPNQTNQIIKHIEDQIK